MSNLRASTTKTSLPSISTPQISYSQRYQHMTKLANYNEMTQNQIWKEYQKLRGCLKQLNEEVLYHMEKKAYKNINQKDKANNGNNKNPNKDTQGVMILLDDQKRSNDVRLSNFTNECNRLQDRIKYLISKPNLLDDLQKEGEQIRAKIKRLTKQNKDLKRNSQMQGRDLINNVSILDALTMEEGKLDRAFKQFKKHEETMKILNQKTQKYKERVSEIQTAIQSRVQQFSKQSNYIEEEIHFQQYEDLKKQKEAIQKYEPIYKRNYLMKLKDLQVLMSSISKHDKVISETEANILSMRSQIDAISAYVGAKRRHSTSVLSGIPRKSSRDRPSSIIDIQLTPNEKSQVFEQKIDKSDINNDKNSVVIKQV